ncbi:hypothetical protein [Haladaptatus sp. DYSN1]|uniref:hypothetical protein n=1 Tax=unclassified Haladaptatus TaxID=2622732 RepID=UPI002404A453|nr:hypothetical protein [Haladaptatus sp. DYSN1]
MRRRAVLSGALPVIYGSLAGCFSMTETNVPTEPVQNFKAKTLDVGDAVTNLSERYRGELNIKGTFPQIALQAPADEKYAGMNWYNEQGERLVTLTADVPDNELSMYVKPDPQGSGNTQPMKLLDIHYAAAKPSVEWKNVNLFKVTGGDTDVHTGDVYLDIGSGKETGDAFFRFLDEQNRPRWSIFMDASVGKDLQFYNHERGDSTLTLDLDANRINVHGNPVFGLREVTNPTPESLVSQEWAWDATNSRWLYKDSKGTTHFFTPDGTL